MTLQRVSTSIVSVLAIAIAFAMIALLTIISVLALITSLTQFQGLDGTVMAAGLRTVVYAVTTSFAQVAIALLVALACFVRWPLNAIALTLLLVPYFLPSTLVHSGVALLFMREGAAATAAHALTIADTPYWFGDEGRFVRLVVESVWQFWPFAFLLAMARLLSAPASEMRAIAVLSGNPARSLLVIGLRHLVVVAGALAIARLMFMSAKFDLPYLASKEAGSNEHNLLTVEVFHALQMAAGDQALATRIAAAPTLLLIAFALLAVSVVLAVSVKRKRRSTKAPPAPEALAAPFGASSTAVAKPFGYLAAFALSLFVLAPLLALVFASVTTNSALQDGWAPSDIVKDFTLEHFTEAAALFGGDAHDNWLNAFGRSLWLSSLVAAASAAFASIAAAWLVIRARSARITTQLLAIAAFGIPTMIWAYVLTWWDDTLISVLPAGICMTDAGDSSIVNGCGETLVPILHLVFTSAIAIYMALAFWTRSTQFAGLRLLLIEGVDARKPSHLLRALLLGSRQHLLNVFCAVFPIVFAVSWSDITFSRFFIHDEGRRLFVDLAANQFGLDGGGGTAFGQMGVAALSAVVIAAVMASVVRTSLK